MNDVRDRALEEAAAWHARLGRSSVTTDQIREFRAWRAEPANAEAYGKIEHAWSTAASLRLDPDILAATEAALERCTLRNRISEAVRAAITPAAGFGFLAAILAAALILPRILPPAYETRTGEQRLVVLKDGSRVRLNTDSKVVVRFSRATRELELVRGEAFFEAAHDVARPFFVSTPGAEVRALGTRFDVRREGEAMQVTLVEGSVRVREFQGGGQWTLAPNQALTVTPYTLHQPQPADTARAISWTTGRLVFHETPLAEAVAEVNRYAVRKIELSAADAAARPVNGVFDTGDTEAFVAAVSTLFDLKAARGADGQIVLSGPAA